jgi:hypothetical protein
MARKGNPLRYRASASEGNGTEPVHSNTVHITSPDTRRATPVAKRNHGLRRTGRWRRAPTRIAATAEAPMVSYRTFWTLGTPDRK